jgi:hypothetical protein
LEEIEKLFRRDEDGYDEIAFENEDENRNLVEHEMPVTDACKSN